MRPLRSRPCAGSKRKYDDLNRAAGPEAMIVRCTHRITTTITATITATITSMTAMATGTVMG